MSTLKDKIDQTCAQFDRLLEQVGSAAFRPWALAVAWTGGKDSTVLLHLWRSWLAARGHASAIPVCAVNLDTGCKFPEVLAFRDELASDWNIAVHVERPDVDISAYPLARDKAACCHDLKIRPLRRALASLGVVALLTGIRRDEHESRRDRAWLERVVDPPHLRLHPLLDFTELDVWACIMEHGLPYCRLYDEGYRSLGCVPCTCLPELAGAYVDEVGERGGRAPDKEQILGQLHSLGYF